MTFLGISIYTILLVLATAIATAWLINDGGATGVLARIRNWLVNGGTALANFAVHNPAKSAATKPATTADAPSSTGTRYTSRP